MTRTSSQEMHKPRKRKGEPTSLDRGYWRESESPLASAVFLLPLIVVYECGGVWLNPVAHRGGAPHVIAFLMIRQFFALFGANAIHLPAIAVVGMLLTWHVAIGDSWRLRLRTMLGMTAESGALAIPVVLLGMVMPRYFPLSAASSDANSFIIYCGAGVYEEFIFRLVLIAFLSFILRDAFELKPILAGVVMVVVSGILFSAYHYLSPQEPAFRMRTFVFRSVAGIYFGVLFLTRGFGVTAASHAYYDIFILVLSQSGNWV